MAPFLENSGILSMRPALRDLSLATYLPRSLVQMASHTGSREIRMYLPGVHSTGLRIPGSSGISSRETRFAGSNQESTVQSLQSTDRDEPVRQPLTIQAELRPGISLMGLSSAVVPSKGIKSNPCQHLQQEAGAGFGAVVQLGQVK